MGKYSSISNRTLAGIVFSCLNRCVCVCFILARCGPGEICWIGNHRNVWRADQLWQMFMRLSAGGWCWRRHGSAWCSRGTSRVCESKPEVRRVSCEQVVLETRARKCGRDPLFPDVAAWISSRGGLGPNQLSWAITLLKCTSDIEKRLKKLGHKDRWRKGKLKRAEDWREYNGQGYKESLN